jgi:hypothetical protein
VKAKSKRNVGRSTKAKASVKAKKSAKAKKPAKATKSAKAKKPAKATKSAKAKTSVKAKAKPRAKSSSRWVTFVQKHGIVLASAKGPVPSVAEAVAGEPIVGSWWAHSKGKAIFAALSEIDDSPDVRCFKLVDGKVTFAHRKTWPALVRLGQDGVIAIEQLASLQQEHMPTGEHRNIVTPFPEWVDDDTAAAATKLALEAARAQLAWIDARS